MDECERERFNWERINLIKEVMFLEIVRTKMVIRMWEVKRSKLKGFDVNLRKIIRKINQISWTINE